MFMNVREFVVHVLVYFWPFLVYNIISAGSESGVSRFGNIDLGMVAYIRLGGPGCRKNRLRVWHSASTGTESERNSELNILDPLYISI